MQNFDVITLAVKLKKLRNLEEISFITFQCTHLRLPIILLKVESYTMLTVFTV